MSRARAPQGFGAKSLFWSVLLAHFRRKENSERLERAFLGSACEQWLNGEFFQAIIAARESVWVRPEKSKRDLVLYSSAEAEEAGDPSLVVETKVLYSPESLTTQAGKLKTLRRQLVGAETDHPRCAAVGLVVYFDYEYSSDDGKTWLPRFDKRARLLSKKEVLSLGLENAFGETQGRARLWSGQEPRTLRFGSFAYRLDVQLQILRTR